MGYYYLTVSWEFLNSVRYSRVVAVAAPNLEEAIDKAYKMVSQQWGRFHVQVHGVRLTR